MPTPVFWPGESHGHRQARLSGFHFHFTSRETEAELQMQDNMEAQIFGITIFVVV